MRKNTIFGAVLAGGAAGMVTGLFGAGGGMVLVPLLTALTGQQNGQRNARHSRERDQDQHRQQPLFALLTVFLLHKSIPFQEIDIAFLFQYSRYSKASSSLLRHIF